MSAELYWEFLGTFTVWTRFKKKKTLELVGYTDNCGTPEYLCDLSQYLMHMYIKIGVNQYESTFMAYAYVCKIWYLANWST